MSIADDDEKIKISAIIAVYTGISSYFISYDENISMILGAGTGIMTYKKYDSVKPYVNRIRENLYGSQWYLYHLDGSPLTSEEVWKVVPDLEYNPPTENNNNGFEAFDIVRYGMAPFTFGMSLGW